jgi:hypothetical protein
MFGFGKKKKEFQGRVIALLPTLGYVEGDAGILHVYSLIDKAYADGLNEYETALAFIFTKIDNLANTDRRPEAQSLYYKANETQAVWAKSGAVRPDINEKFKAITSSINLDATVKAIVSCPSCKQKCRINKGKTTKVTCPKCSNVWVEKF